MNRQLSVHEGVTAISAKKAEAADGEIVDTTRGAAIGYGPMWTSLNRSRLP